MSSMNDSPTMIQGTQKRSMRKFAYFELYGIKRTKRNERKFTAAFMAQLGACKSDEARRLLLGISELFTEPQAFTPVGMSPAVAERVRARAA